MSPSLRIPARAFPASPTLDDETHFGFLHMHICVGLMEPPPALRARLGPPDSPPLHLTRPLERLSLQSGLCPTAADSQLTPWD